MSDTRLREEDVRRVLAQHYGVDSEDAVGEIMAELREGERLSARLAAAGIPDTDQLLELDDDELESMLVKAGV